MEDYRKGRNVDAPTERGRSEENSKEKEKITPPSGSTENLPTPSKVDGKGPPSAAAITEEASSRAPTLGVEEPDTDADAGAAPAGSGWKGVGDKMQVGNLSRRREFIDGGGLCSPGRREPGSRALPKGLPYQFRSWLLGALKNLSDNTGKPFKVLLAEVLGGKN